MFHLRDTNNQLTLQLHIISSPFWQLGNISDKQVLHQSLHTSRLVMSVPLSVLWTQFFPLRGPLTESNLPRQDDKVFIVTGGSSGLGYELSRILYGAGGKVYILTRSKANADAAIARIKAHYQGQEDSRQCGNLEFIYMDLQEFSTIKAAVQEFLQSQGPEGRLDVLFNNAGTGGRKNAPAGRQGHEYHMTINALGGFLLTRLLTSILSKTALSTSTCGSVRVVWPASLLVDTTSPKSGIRKD
ncbi:hypothetical protein VP1G_01680 [Cytospora mali]|uniref:NAD(P)-binding protein n=1 Tax=Cytospora mali TaxID=578113 RepID=A0A194URI8_CYTMA|nr:hypothetical protein VP1G_01680 [Valsa mali var. pyri (nom. inval.)]